MIMAKSINWNWTALKRILNTYLIKEYKFHRRLLTYNLQCHVFHSALTTEDYEIPEGHYEEEQMKQTVVPNRNAIFASILYGYALSIALKNNEKVRIALGVHSGDHEIYPDCRPEFYEALENAFKIGNWESDKVPKVLTLS